jgi:hypothetical protein
MKARVDVPLAAGAAVKLAFALPEGDPIDVIALVVRADRDGVIFTFVNPGESARERLVAAVQRLARA